jgi:protein-L-isoaspartate O-methyltransferase
MPARATRTRREMIDVQIAGRGIRDKCVLEALRVVRRGHSPKRAWKNSRTNICPLPIGASQTISQSYIVALMLEAAKLSPSDRVLDAGSGYAAALYRAHAAITRRLIEAHTFNIVAELIGRMPRQSTATVRS